MGIVLHSKINKKYFPLFLMLLLSVVSACMGGSSDLGGAAGGGGSYLGGTQVPPPGGIVPPGTPPPPGGGGQQGAAPPLDSGAVGPMTDYSQAVLMLNCGGSSCIKKPAFPIQDDSENQCEYTYKIKGVLKLSIHSFPMPDRVIRVFNRDTGKFRDLVTDDNGGFEIIVTVDEHPRIEFWATDLSRFEAVVENWEECAGSCILPHFLPLPTDSSCSFLNHQSIPRLREGLYRL